MIGFLLSGRLQQQHPYLNCQCESVKSPSSEIVDSIFLLEFNSADDYAQMKEGQTYKVNGYWFRLPLLSWFPKIYKFSPNA